MLGFFRRSRPAEVCAGGRLAIVLQATGSHAWGVGRGWVEAARRIGALGAVLAPRAKWKARSVADDGGVASWLAEARPGDTALLLGFDWHSQGLHRTGRWRARWERTRARKLLYVHESIATHRRLTGDDEMERAFRSAAELCDGVLFADPADRPLVESSGKACLWQPFGVDDELFRPTTPFDRRAGRAYFRGKVEPIASENDYADRRRLLEALRARQLVDYVPYAPGPLDPATLVGELDGHQVAVNLPSVFASHPTRVTEAMACGCCVVTNRTGVPECDALFRDGLELLYYDDEGGLIRAVERARDDSELARAIAERARAAVVARFSLTRLLGDALDWWEGRVPAPAITSGARRSPAR
jgi:hypothetical protein